MVEQSASQPPVDPPPPPTPPEPPAPPTSLESSSSSDPPSSAGCEAHPTIARATTDSWRRSRRMGLVYLRAFQLQTWLATVTSSMFQLASEKTPVEPMSKPNRIFMAAFLCAVSS